MWPTLIIVRYVLFLVHMDAMLLSRLNTFGGPSDRFITMLGKFYEKSLQIELQIVQNELLADQ